MARKQNLQFRINVILDWLKWLQDIGNPYYQDIKLPETEQEKINKKNELNKEIEKIWDSVLYCDSDEVNKKAEQTRANVRDTKDGLDENPTEGDIVRNIFVCNNYETKQTDPMQNVVQNIQQIMQSTEHKRKKNKIDPDIEHIENIDDQIVVYSFLF